MDGALEELEGGVVLLGGKGGGGEERVRRVGSRRWDVKEMGRHVKDVGGTFCSEKQLPTTQQA